ncbi:hypothetical protein Hdeb2414_s0001g00017121 [Helianthus debilis subsp. tardiflorus]
MVEASGCSSRKESEKERDSGGERDRGSGRAAPPLTAAVGAVKVVGSDENPVKPPPLGFISGGYTSNEREREREPVLVVIGGSRLGPMVLASDRRVSRRR